MQNLLAIILLGYNRNYVSRPKMAVETTFAHDAFDMFQIDRHAMDFHKPLQLDRDEDEPVVVNACHVACPQYAGKIIASGKVLAPRGIAEADIWPVIDKFTF